MKNTFAVTMTLLLALTIGGSVVGYNIATTPHHSEKGGHGEEKGGHSESGAPMSEQGPSANSAATGAAGAEGALGDVKADNEGGAQTGENGAVPASGEAVTGDETVASQEGSSTDTDTAGSTGQQPAETAAAAETQGDAVAGEKSYAVSCAGCHGANGQGVVGPSLVAANGPKDWTLAQFTTSLREGRTPERELAATMPRFSDAQLTDSDIANVQAYIKTLN
ncbi:c-type cytochrome [Deinococcus xianganensis]|uniref:C-type cytochrome n=1 Tax=Deinococcus xianganensis TaxID=1507289 RepID=A0A6I4YK28_9DEIO|nr:cytochrome c [Deinococcus xianganensis]MXV20094.1 c-type cytochrome [Deinococcus xianganensis]